MVSMTEGARLANEESARRAAMSAVRKSHSEIEALRIEVSELRELIEKLVKPAHICDDQIKHMVNRFLMWKLPKPFRPDARISFDPPAPLNPGTPYENDLWPIGTNLFDADQAEAMVRHMIEGLPC